MELPKLSILIFIEHYLPGYKFGGPIRSVVNLITLLKPHYDVYLVTRDRDQGDTTPYAGIVTDEWLYQDSYHLLYLSPNKITISTIRQLITARSYDFIYTNSLLSRFTRLLLLLAVFSRRQLIIAPRGELHAGAIRLKTYKKRPYVALVRLLANDLVVWHATDQQEVTAIQRAFNRPRVTCVPIRFAPDVPGRLDERKAWQKQTGQLRLLSVARIARNKGLKFLLECLPSVTSGSIVLAIYGPIVDGRYWDECRRLIAALPAQHQVTYWGELDHAAVGHTMQQYDFLTMPTHGENFGHVIFEALSSGLPVLISDQTPWQQLSAIDAGWDLPLHHDQWIDQLDRCLAMDQIAYSLLVSGAARKAQAYVDSESFEASYARLFSR